ncbi:TetR/AcrR family transcriptional regulator [Nocardiopsis coralliicola]
MATRTITRRAILSAAPAVLARNPSATLADIADAAGVGRSTLHRYFADREDLVTAAVEDSLAEVNRSIRDAALGQGTVQQSLRRLIAAMVDAADRLMFLWGDPRVLEAFTEPQPSDAGTTALSVVQLIERGQTEGVFDPEVSVEWIQNVIWAVVHTGVEQAAHGQVPRHGVHALVVRTLENGLFVHPE